MAKTTAAADDGDTDPHVAADATAVRGLGAAVRRRRRALGMRQGDLAAAAGLSVPFVSQIETGFASPSLMSLFAIARVLGTTPERLLAGPMPNQVTVIRRGTGRVYAVTDAANPALRRQLTSLDEPFSAAEYVVEPGADLGGFAASSGREMIHMVEGELIVDVVTDGSEVAHHLHPGDTLIYSTSDTHRWRHAGTVRSRFLLVVSDPRRGERRSAAEAASTGGAGSSLAATGARTSTVSDPRRGERRSAAEAASTEPAQRRAREVRNGRRQRVRRT
ncbi:MAG: XRE family transcriptional regulator [Ilumatobacteraceae bacterium]